MHRGMALTMTDMAYEFSSVEMTWRNMQHIPKVCQNEVLNFDELLWSTALKQIEQHLIKINRLEIYVSMCMILTHMFLSSPVLWPFNTSVPPDFQLDLLYSHYPQFFLDTPSMNCSLEIQKQWTGTITWLTILVLSLSGMIVLRYLRTKVFFF